jgi:regulator of RNase E activity RraA
MDADKTLRLADAGLQPRTAARRLLGRVRTLFAREDFMTVMVALEAAEPGEVLVIDTRGSRRAVVGELFTLEAHRRGLAGIVVEGPVRDAVTLRALDFPVYARTVTPLAGTLRELQPMQQPVNCGGVTVQPGDLLVGDDDGIVVLSRIEAARVLPEAERIKARERALMARMRAGESLLALLDFESRQAGLAGHPDAGLSAGRTGEV